VLLVHTVKSGKCLGRYEYHTCITCACSKQVLVFRTFLIQLHYSCQVPPKRYNLPFLVAPLFLVQDWYIKLSVFLLMYYFVVQEYLSFSGEIWIKCSEVIIAICDNRNMKFLSISLSIYDNGVRGILHEPLTYE
jgi:hypothetical protein